MMDEVTVELGACADETSNSPARAADGTFKRTSRGVSWRATNKTVREYMSTVYGEEKGAAAGDGDDDDDDDSADSDAADSDEANPDCDGGAHAAARVRELTDAAFERVVGVLVDATLLNCVADIQHRIKWAEGDLRTAVELLRMAELMAAPHLQPDELSPAQGAEMERY